PLGFVVYRAKDRVPVSPKAPGITITAPHDGDTVVIATDMMDGHAVDRRVEVRAELDTDAMAEVTFLVSEDGGDYQLIGTDDNAPYRLFFDPSHLRGSEDTSLTFRAIVNDLSGHLASDEVVDVGVEFPIPEPEQSTTLALIHYQRADGAYGDHTTGNFNDFWGLHLWGNGVDVADVTDWTSPKPFLGEDEYGRFAWVTLTDVTQPVNFIVHRGDTKDTPDDRSFDPVTMPEIWLKDGDATVYGSQAAAQGFATVHYECTAPCAGVTIDATSDGAPVETDSPPDAIDDYGAVFRLSPADVSAPLTVTIEVGGVADVTAQVFTPTDTPTAWLQAGEQVVYESRGAAEDFALLHYRRPAGDYGNYASSDFNDFWGLHVWTGSTDPGWTTPIEPVGEDVFGVVFRVPLVDGATTLSYIIHRGDTKDPGPDQSLVFDRFGHEVWQLQAADPDDPYVAPLRD
ncbi:MAG TPA: pullulanase-associated domain-containing protein, partial [Ilumatobacteraceae bacterium]